MPDPTWGMNCLYKMTTNLLYRFGAWLARRNCPYPPKIDIGKVVTIDLSDHLTQEVWHNVCVNYWIMKEKPFAEVFVDDITVAEVSLWSRS